MAVYRIINTVQRLQFILLTFIYRTFIWTVPITKILRNLISLFKAICMNNFIVVVVFQQTLRFINSTNFRMFGTFSYEMKYFT